MLDQKISKSKREQCKKCKASYKIINGETTNVPSDDTPEKNQYLRIETFKQVVVIFFIYNVIGLVLVSVIYNSVIYALIKIYSTDGIIIFTALFYFCVFVIHGIVSIKYRIDIDTKMGCILGRDK